MPNPMDNRSTNRDNDDSYGSMRGAISSGSETQLPMKKRTPMLSKSRFIAGLQCLKRLWNDWYRYDEIPQPDRATQAIFDTGYAVGVLAHRLVPGGVLVAEDHRQHTDARNTTLRLMADPAVPAIYEAAFTFEDIRIRADILKRLPGGQWQLLEVKSSTNVKDCNRYDVAIQKYVLEGCGLKIASACLVHVNNQYVYDGESLDVEQFLTVNDLTDTVDDLMPSVRDWLAKERMVLAQNEAPDIPPGKHCHQPYECCWYSECRAAMPRFWVEELYRISPQQRSRLKTRGVRDIAAIPADFALSPIQSRIRESVRSGQILAAPGLKNAFARLQYPIHYLDFETFMPCIPRYRGTRPYQTLPFQWSDHVLHQDGRLEHAEWLCDSDRDPRQDCAASLIDQLGRSGSIVTYGHYERTQLNALADSLPHRWDDLQAIIQRLWNLEPVISGHIAHPQLYNSFSLKRVLPALLPDMGYDALDIQEGSAAGIGYLEMIDTGTTPERQAELRKQLLEYCGLDTLAMVKLHQKCLKLATQLGGAD